MGDCHRRFPVAGQHLNSWRLNFFNFYYKVKTLEGDFELSLIKISLSPGGKFTEKWLALPGFFSGWRKGSNATRQTIRQRD
jgi:hypothetical protein